MKRFKNKNIPKSPETVAEVATAFKSEAIFDMYGRNDGEPRKPFYRGTVIDEAYSFTVFSSEAVLERISMQSNNIYYVDGTFGVVPRGEYKQLLVIHLEYLQHVSFVFKFYKKIKLL